MAHLDPTARHRAIAQPAHLGEDAAPVLRLAYRPPLAWESLLSFLAARATPGVERVTASEYVRTVAIGNAVGRIRVAASAERDELQLRVSRDLAPHLGQIVRSARDLFDLDARPDVIAESLSVDPELAALVRARPGLRVPGAFDPFEIAVRAVLAQQISVAGATTLSGRVAATFGRMVEPLEPGLDRETPSPDALASASIASLRAIGMPEMRARALSLLSRAIAEGEIDLESRTEPAQVIERLLAIPGIGPFTAHVIAMRVLRDPDAFPENDLIVKRRLGARPLLRAEPWRPFRAYAVIHVWADAGAKR